MSDQTPNLKRCSKCRLEKPTTEFHNSKNRADGKHPYCKLCRKTEAETQFENAQKTKRDWYDRNKDKAIASAKSRHLALGSAAVKKYKHEHYLANSAHIKAKVVVWRKNHPHIVTWRTILWNALKRMGQPKNGRTIVLLGYSAEELRTHIEALWTNGMAWDNHGEWHVDHIRPVSSFERTTLPCVVNALSNLQPLWATTRVIDGITYEGNLNKQDRWDE